MFILAGCWGSRSNETHLWLGAVERGQGAGWFFGESKSQRCWHPHSMIQSTKTLSNTMGSGPPNSQSLSSTWTRGYIQSISNRLPELPKINHRHQYVIRANHSTAKISRVPYRTTWKKHEFDNACGGKQHMTLMARRHPPILVCPCQHSFQRLSCHAVVLSHLRSNPVSMPGTAWYHNTSDEVFE